MHDRALSIHTDAAVRGGRSSGVAPHIGKLADVFSGPLGSLAVRSLRVRPRQMRSIESVERILSAAAEMTFHQKSPDSISIEKISAEAGVTPQAAYRYFKDADELVETGLRCVVIREHEQVIRLLSKRVLSNDAEMARAVVCIVIESCERLSRFPEHMREAMFRQYRQVGYDASLQISELLCKDVDRADIRHSLDVVKASVALTATTAVATSFFSREIAPFAPLRGTRLEEMLATMFVGVLQSGGSSSDAFHEMGSELDVFWKSETG